jgi:DNA-binding response OmpR family regulator
MPLRIGRCSHVTRSGRETFAKLATSALAAGATPPYPDAVGAQVLIVDDEPMVREVVARYLERDGARVHEAADGPAALAWLDQHQPDLVVLDVMLPGVDGLSILRRIRDGGEVPVILLTARSDEVDRIVGLELGADDYVVKPFSPRELAARVRTVLRRSSGPTRTDRLDFGALVIDAASREVFVDGTAASLTAKEFDLLATLARSPRQVLSRAQLLDLVWASSPDYQDPATVTVHVGRIRQKIEADPERPRWITTVRSVGYRFEP